MTQIIMVMEKRQVLENINRTSYTTVGSEIKRKIMMANEKWFYIKKSNVSIQKSTKIDGWE